jgi:hypothetical protein
MRRDERLAADDHFGAIGLERIRRVVEADIEEHFQKKIGGAVDEKLQPWIVDDAAALHEPAAKHTLVTVIERAPIADDVPGVVGLVRHHDHHCVAAHVTEAKRDGPPEPVRARIPDGP